jgi:hypothetical protein
MGQLIHHEGTKDTKGTKKEEENKERLLLVLSSFVFFVPSW